jgi:hypothetical protein
MQHAAGHPVAPSIRDHVSTCTAHKCNLVSCLLECFHMPESQASQPNLLWRHTIDGHLFHALLMLFPCDTHYIRAEGGRGSVDLANAVIAACDAAKQQASTLKYLYPLDMPIKVGGVYVYACMCMCMCMCMRVCVYVHVYVHVNVYTCMCMCMCLCVGRGGGRGSLIVPAARNAGSV